MLPIGPLMIEHRLMERLFALLKKEGERIEREKNVNLAFLSMAIDFFKIYSDRCHHGKEEDFLFKELEKKPLSEEHAGILAQLWDDHRQSRKMLAELEEAGADYGRGKKESAVQIPKVVRSLLDLYSRHIDMEDKHFFLPVMQYFSQEEKDSMLDREKEFDRNLVHEIYREKVMSEEARFE